MNKKGISPMIATILIIGFTIALAAVIMSWGQQFADERLEEEKASDIIIDIDYPINNESNRFGEFYYPNPEDKYCYQTLCPISYNCKLVKLKNGTEINAGCIVGYSNSNVCYQCINKSEIESIKEQTATR